MSKKVKNIARWGEFVLEIKRIIDHSSLRSFAILDSLLSLSKTLSRMKKCAVAMGANVLKSICIVA